MTPAPTYEDIAPLVAHVDDRGPEVLVTFRCPVTGTEVGASGAWPDAGMGG
jgi:hypothetical protein